MRAAIVAIALVACGGSPAPEKPSPAVEHEVGRAEDAERARQHDEARRRYQAAITAAHDPASIGFAHRELGETLATWGEFADSRTHLEAAVAATPDDPIAWQMLGIVRHKLDDIPGAFAALERSKQLAPRSWIPRRDLAVLHWKLGHRAEALAEYQAMLDLDLPERLREKARWAIGELER